MAKGWTPAEVVRLRIKMKQQLSCLCAAIILTSIGIKSASAQLRVLEGDSISFGRVYQTGAKVNQVVLVQNAGSDTVRINRVSTSCGCTVALVSRHVLAPGEKAKVRIQFDPAGYIGDVTKYIYISNSFPGNQLVTVKMTGYIAYALQPTPNFILFIGRVGKKDSVKIKLTNDLHSPMTITRVDVPSKEITYRLSGLDLEARGIRKSGPLLYADQQSRRWRLCRGSHYEPHSTTAANQVVYETCR